MKHIMIFDGNSILNRAFYAIRLLTSKSGEYTNAIYGFLNICLKHIESDSPDVVCVAFDLRDPTFRHKEDQEYKANRKGMPDELAAQLDNTKAICKALGYHILTLAGYEADDIIGTVAKKCEQGGDKCSVVTSDRDLLQLAGTNTLIKLVKNANVDDKLYYKEDFIKEYGITPEQYVDVKAIMGDSSDNIKGIAGIGEKGAFALIQKFHSLEEIYDNINTIDVKPKMREKLIAGKEDAFHSRFLAKIDTDVPIDLSILEKPLEQDRDTLLELFTRLDFNQFIDRLSLRQPQQETDLTVIDDEEKLNAFLNENSIAGYSLQDSGLFAATQNGRYQIGPAFHKAFFESESLLKIGFGVKADITALQSKKIAFRGLLFDVLLAAYVLNSQNGTLDCEHIAYQYLDTSKSTEENNFALYPVLKQKLKDEGVDKLYDEIELPLTRVLAEMELTGIGIDIELTKQLSADYDLKIKHLLEDIYQMAGEEFNVASPKQLGVILFEKLHLPVLKKTKTGYSTGAEILERLRSDHPIIDKILEYRRFSKLKSTYIDGFLSVVDPRDGRVHTLYNQTLTHTGRLSSTEPNLQNIPIRYEEGRELRKMFCAGENKIFVGADYSQIELRVLAELSQDEMMGQAFLQNEDIHTQTASLVFNIPPQEVTPELRRRAKAVNFGIVYGIGEFSLSQDIGVTRRRAGEYIEQYKAKYSGISRYLDHVVQSAKEIGYTTTMFGRRRYIPELFADNFNLRSFGERAAMNAPIQGSAADIMKCAMVKVYNRIQKENLNAKIILQIHDELVLETPLNEQEQVKEILKYEMEHAVKSRIPFLAEVNAGKDLYELK